MLNYKVGNAARMGEVANAMGAAGQALQITNQNLDAKKISAKYTWMMVLQELDSFVKYLILINLF